MASRWQWRPYPERTVPTSKGPPMIRARMLVLGVAAALALVVGCTLGVPASSSQGGGAVLLCGRPAGTANAVGRLVLRANQCLVVQEPDGRLRQVFLAAETNVYPALPVWSPNGARIAFTQQRFFNGRPGADWGDDLYIVPADGGAPELVRAHTLTGEQVQGVAWSGDGSALLFGDFTPVMKDGLIAAYDGHLKRVDLATKQETTVLEGAFTPSLSRDGKRMAFMREEGLFIANADGTTSTQLVPRGRFQTLYFPRISPDGTSVVFSASAAAPATREVPRARPREGILTRLAARLVDPRVAAAHGVPMDVWRVDVATKALTQLTTLAEDDPFPAWSADGKRLIVFATGGLYEVASDGSNTKTIGPGTFGGHVDAR